MISKSKKMIKKVIASCIVICIVFVLMACSGKVTRSDIALVTDVGQLMDAGFNQGTWEGIKEFAISKNKTYNYYQPKNDGSITDEDRVRAMEEAVRDGAKIIIVPGYSQAAAIEVVASKYPDVKFVFVDGWALGLFNVTAINYKEEESGYMAGYAAVMDGYRKIGGTFGGGGTNPACNRFCYGYIQGAADAAKEINEIVEIKYSYKYGEEFQASEKLEKQIEKWYEAGTEVVFSCGGSMFYSVKRASEKTKKAKIIGVDVDQAILSTRVITSAVKKLSVSVQKILSQYYNDEWDNKLSNRVVNLGANDDATGIPYDTSKFKKFSRAQYVNLYNGIKEGKIKIDADVPEDCNNPSWFLKKYEGNENVVIIFDNKG